MNNYNKALKKVACANENMNNTCYYCVGPTGPAGKSLEILGSFPSLTVKIIKKHHFGQCL